MGGYLNIGGRRITGTCLAVQPTATAGPFDSARRLFWSLP
jgi:hypothetical protein